MKLVKPYFLSPFNLYDDKVNLLVIENKNMFYNFVQELYDSILGEQSNIVLSKNNKPVKTSSMIELITCFIPFEINNKKIISKLYDRLKKSSVETDLIADTYEIEMAINAYILKLCENFNFELEFDNNIDIKSLLKAINLKFSDNIDNLSEKIFEYMTNVRELEGEKIFAMVNLSSYISNDDLQLFIETAVNHRFYLLLIENCDNVFKSDINKRIIDDDLCEI